MRRAIIAGLMAVGLLAGCGGTSDEEVVAACANGTTCTGSVAQCEATCGPSADAAEKNASWVMCYCCDGTSIMGVYMSSCFAYCADRDGVCN
ncbi:hypothetical protein D7X55_21530 [Corallococcus sp. AB049A]|uniref:Lipoprotein n=1 Tax=Corallococcus interemptor TaxID=2316720 RepID=A0A3A8Q5P8_9BACT|nr:hypothetical protein D7X96_26500 [Corallococcus interemptor]RKI62950.1 hypothetical protein D7X55_21530 [Corallococcus sp. AB049A]